MSSSDEEYDCGEHLENLDYNPDDDPYSPSNQRLLTTKKDKMPRNEDMKQLAPVFQNLAGPSKFQYTGTCTPSTSTFTESTGTSQSPIHEIKSKLFNPLWNHYLKINLSDARCKTCSKVLKMGESGTTSSLIKHLKQHKPIYDNYMTEKKSQEQAKAKRKLEIPTSEQSSSKQQKVTEMFQVNKWPSDSKDQKRVNGLISKFIVQGLHAYSIVEEPGFKNLINAGFPRYSVPCRTTMSRSLIPKMYADERTKLKSVLCSDLPFLEGISFTTDGWKSRSGDAYLSLTCHYVDREWNYKSFNLTNSLFEGRQTGENIANFLMLQMENWNIPVGDQSIPIYVVTDGGKNIVSAVRQTPFKHRQCFAHKLQLVVKGAVNLDTSAQDMLQKSRSIVGHYHKSTAATARLKKIQVQLGMTPPKCVIQMVDTRWNSEFYMLERLVELKKAISSELATSQHCIENLNNEEWDLAEGYLEALKPIEIITNIMSASKYPTTSMIIPVLNEIETNLNKIVSSFSNRMSNKSLKTTSFAKNLLNQLKTKFIQYKDDNINQISTALDPRFKCVLFERNLIEKNLINLASQTQCRNKQSSDSAKTMVTTISTASSSKSKLWVAFDSAAAKVQQTNTYSPATKEVQRYLEEGLVDKTVNPYSWWKKEAYKYPILSNLAALYLPIPATQASSERLFSAAGNIITSRRESLSPKHAEQLLFLHSVCNKDC